MTSVNTDTRAPLVYILVLNWNGAGDTIECLNSLNALSYPNVVVAVVDNGSSDDSVARIKAAHPGVTMIQSGANRGFAGGNNIGIRWALQQGAAMVWLLNNDTVVFPDTLTHLVAASLVRPRAAMIGSVLVYADSGRVQAHGGGWISLVTGRAHHFKKHFENRAGSYLVAASVLIPRWALEAIGLLDETFFMYWEDTDLSFRIRAAGYELAVAEEARVLHKESASLRGKSPLLDEYFSRSAVVFFGRHAPAPLLPIGLSLLGRVAKRVLRRDWVRVRSTLRGAFVRNPSQPESAAANAMALRATTPDLAGDAVRPADKGHRRELPVMDS